MNDQAKITSPNLTKKERFLMVAEIFDAYRVVPRIILALYGTLLYKLYTWFSAIETVVKTTCDTVLIKFLVEHGENIIEAQQLACSVADVVGGPTTAQAAFVATVVGVAAPIFAFYTNTGRGWNKKKEED